MPGRDFRPADPLSARRRREPLLVRSGRVRFGPRPTSREAGRARRGVEGGRKRPLQQSRPQPLGGSRHGSGTAPAGRAAASGRCRNPDRRGCRSGPKRRGSGGPRRRPVGAQVEVETAVSDEPRGGINGAVAIAGQRAMREHGMRQRPAGSLPRNGRNRAHKDIAPAPHARLCPFPKRKGRPALFIRLMIVVRARKRPCLDGAAPRQYSAGARLARRSIDGQPVTGGHGASCEPDPPAGRCEIPSGQGSSAGRTTFG